MCGVEDETVTHLFAECSYSTKLWEELQNALSLKLSSPNLSPQNVVLGIIDCQSSFVAINHLLLLYKRYIHLCRMEVKSISSGASNVFLQNITNIEKKKTAKNNILRITTKSETFFSTWCSYKREGIFFYIAVI